jgi:hypothetical protein
MLTRLSREPESAEMLRVCATMIERQAELGPTHTETVPNVFFLHPRRMCVASWILLDFRNYVRLGRL